MSTARRLALAAWRKGLGTVGKRLTVGQSVWPREWDILAVLDGCRLDTYRAVTGRDVGCLTSPATTSAGWYRHHFGDGDGLERVGLVTGNPFVDVVDTEPLGYCHREPVRETAYGVETVPPDRLAAHAARVWRDRDELGVDRLVVHFMQPHAPFRSRPEWFEAYRGTDTWGSEVWLRAGAGEIDETALWAAYADSLQWGLQAGVRRLEATCEATIAVTSDHGQAAGEWGVWGHPGGVPLRALQVVPWDVREGTGDERVTGDVEPTTDVDTAAQLEALGYV